MAEQNQKLQFLDKAGLNVLVDNIINLVDESTENSVKYQEFPGRDVEGNAITRNTIQLKNYDTISGIDTKGNGHNLVMLSQWDVADMGAKGVVLNLNGKGERPTYNDTEEIALLSDIPDSNMDDEEVRKIAAEEVAKIVDGAPADLDTFKELAEALGNDKNAVSAINSSITTINGKIDDIENTLVNVVEHEAISDDYINRLFGKTTEEPVEAE